MIGHEANYLSFNEDENYESICIERKKVPKQKYGRIYRVFYLRYYLYILSFNNHMENQLLHSMGGRESRIQSWEITKHNSSQRPGFFIHYKGQLWLEG